MSDRGFDRVALVIGGASGIGWAVAKGLAVDGCRVTIADLDADGASQRAGELGVPHTGAAVDVTDEDAVAALSSGWGRSTSWSTQPESAESGASPNCLSSSFVPSWTSA